MEKFFLINEKYYSVVFNEVIPFNQFFYNFVIVKKLFTREEVDEWKKKYNFDNFSSVMWISETHQGIKLKSTSPEELLDYEVGEVDKEELLPTKLTFPYRHFNTKIFNDQTIANKGKIIIESEVVSGVYLYLFDKNKNRSVRTARQVHGFNYQEDIINDNDFLMTNYTEKWDTFGKISNDFLLKRLSNGKSIKYNDVSTIDEENIKTHYSTFTTFRHWMPWSIKVKQLEKDVEMGDFTRVCQMCNSMFNYGFKYFMFNVAFWEDSSTKDITEEYFVVISKEKWEYYVGEFFVSSFYNEMLEELADFGQKGEVENERVRVNSYSKIENEKFITWSEYMKYYQKKANDMNCLFDLRFKRDSKSQKRIQCSISYNNFINVILKNNYLHIFRTS